MRLRKSARQKAEKQDAGEWKEASLSLRGGEKREGKRSAKSGERKTQKREKELSTDHWEERNRIAR